MQLRNLETQFQFAGFTWPRYVARMACGAQALRAKRESRRVVGEYYHAPRPVDRTTDGRGFYLGSDGQPFTRWQWADDAAPRTLRHTGWLVDDYGGEKIRGLVVMLPHGRFLAGWSMGVGMASVVDGYVYDNATDAALAADSMAELAADSEREYRDDSSDDCA